MEFPLDHGYDLLPLLSDLLKSKVLTKSSVCLAVEAINGCVDAEVLPVIAGISIM